MREDLLRVASRAVAAAEAIDVPCEAFVQKRRSTSIVIEKGQVTFAAQDGDYGIGLRVINGRQTGYAYCDERSIEFGLKQALAVSRYSKPGPYAFACGGAANGARSIFDNSVATMVAEDGVQLARDMIDGASCDRRAILTGGGISFGVISYAVANTSGLAAFDEGTFIGSSTMVVLKEGDQVVNGWESTASRRRDFSCEAVGRSATERAVGQLGQKPAPTAAMDVILRPDAAFDILSNTVMPALYGDAVRKGESVYAGKTGQPVAARGISILDDATHPRGLNTFATDEEGYPSQRTVLLDKGDLVGLLYDEFSAREADARPTGSCLHAERMSAASSYKAPPVTCARNLALEGPEASEEELIRDVRRGVIVDHVLGAHTANRASGDFSVAIYEGHYIEDGAIAYPLKGGMIGGNMPRMLREAALADNYKLVEAAMSPAAGIIPSIKFANVQVSGS